MLQTCYTGGIPQSVLIDT